MATVTVSYTHLDVYKRQIDMLDQEVNTPAGAPVDTRGIALDSDGDNIADYKDKEPYSPPGYLSLIHILTIVLPRTICCTLLMKCTLHLQN